MRRLSKNLFPNGVQQKDVIEFYGDEGTGKTQMLLHLMTRCLLPSLWKSVELCGLNAGVVYVDTDYHFSMLRLTNVMDQCVRSCISRTKKNHQQNAIDGNSNWKVPKDEDIEDLIKQSLGKLHIVKCNSSVQLVLSLYALDSVFGNKPEVCLLLLDSISAFYWIDRSNGADSYSAQELNQRRISDAINKLREDYNIISIVTKHAIFQKKSKDKSNEKTEGDFSPFVNTNTGLADKSSEHCEYMCKTWQKLVTHRFIFSKQNIATRGKDGEVKQTQLFTVKGGTVTAQSESVTLNFYVTDMGVLFIE